MSTERPENHMKHLPSLEETAEVPTKHRDDLHSPEHWEGLQETIKKEEAVVPVDQSQAVLFGKRTREEEYGERAKNSSGHINKYTIGATATAAAIAIGIGSWMGISGGSDKATESKQKPAASAPANPSEQAPDQAELTMKSIEREYSVAEYPTGEAVTRAFLDDRNALTMSTATEETYDSWDINVAPTDEEFVRQATAPYQEAFSKAKLPADWEDREGVAKLINGMYKNQEAVTILHFWTMGNGDDAEPYEYTIDFDSVTDIPTNEEGKVSASYSGAIRDNSDQNSANERWDEPRNGVPIAGTLTWEDIDKDGNWEIVDAS